MPLNCYSAVFIPPYKTTPNGPYQHIIATFYVSCLFSDYTPTRVVFVFLVFMMGTLQQRPMHAVNQLGFFFAVKGTGHFWYLLKTVISIQAMERC